MPEIPTSYEAGVAGLYTSGWFGLFAPQGTPMEIIARLNGTRANRRCERALQNSGSMRPREQQTPAGLAPFPQGDVLQSCSVIPRDPAGVTLAFGGRGGTGKSTIGMTGPIESSVSWLGGFRGLFHAVSTQRETDKPLIGMRNFAAVSLFRVFRRGATLI
jgi:hypothetical protein